MHRPWNYCIITEEKKSMTISKDPLRCKLVIEDEPIEQILVYKISSRENLETKVERNINKAAAISGHLKNAWKNKYIKVTTKRMLNMIEIKTIRAITGNIILGKKKNEDLRKQTLMTSYVGSAYLEDTVTHMSVLNQSRKASYRQRQRFL